MKNSTRKDVFLGSGLRIKSLINLVGNLVFWLVLRTRPTALLTVWLLQPDVEEGLKCKRTTLVGLFQAEPVLPTSTIQQYSETRYKLYRFDTGYYRLQVITGLRRANTRIMPTCSITEGSR